MVGNSFPYSDRLISHHTKQISLPYPFPPTLAKKCQTGFLDFIRMFIAIVMPHSLFQISIFWSKLEWESLDCEGRKLGLRVLNVRVAGESLKKLFSAFLRNLNSRGKIVLIMNQLNIANCSKVHLNYFIYIKFWTI